MRVVEVTTVLEKMAKLKYILDWNLNVKGMDILPMFNEIVEQYKLEQEEDSITIEELDEEAKKTTGVSDLQKGVEDKDLGKTGKKVKAPKPVEIKVGDTVHAPDKDGRNISIEVTEDNISDIESGALSAEDVRLSKLTIKELRKEYKEKYGKNAFNGWNEEQLISKLK